MKQLLQRALDAARSAWAHEPARVTAIVVAGVLTIAGQFHVVISADTITAAVGLVLPVLLGGEITRKLVAPAWKSRTVVVHALADPGEHGDTDLFPDVPVADPAKLPADRGEGRVARGVKPASSSPLLGASASGLSAHHRDAARGAIKHAIDLCFTHSTGMNYTQGARRWEGITRKLFASDGSYPRYSDCSSWGTWVLYQGLRLFGVRDLVNGLEWRAGYTGSAIVHGKEVAHDANLQLGDIVFYGPSRDDSRHEAVYIGGGFVASHGGPGLHKLPIDYRPDRLCARRFI